MNRVKSVVAAAALTFFIAVTTAGQVPPVCNPGETNGPPCPARATTSEDLAVVSGETHTPSEAQSVEIVSLVELAFDILLLF